MSTPVLWQFRYSHYNERVRWALDYKGIAHERRSLLPGPHMLPMMLKSGQRQVPVLEIDGQRIADSTRILEAVEKLQPQPALYPAEGAARGRTVELETFFDAEVGPPLRLAWFHELLSDPAFLGKLLSGGAPPWQRAAYAVMFPVIRRIMAADMKINAANAGPARARVHAALDRLEAEIQPSGYLVGDRFTAADLTVAALFCPLVMPPEFAYPWPQSIPPPAARWRDDLVPRRGFQWVQEIFRRHRGTSKATNE